MRILDGLVVGPPFSVQSQVEAGRSWLVEVIQILSSLFRDPGAGGHLLSIELVESTG
jgi:hypothetical protein